MLKGCDNKVKQKKNRIGIFFVVLLVSLCMLPTMKTEAASKRKVTSVAITNVYNDKLTIEKGKTYTLKTSVSPSNASDKRVTWKSSNSKIVKVSSSGKLTAVKAGTAKITVTARDGSKKKDTITVTVGTRVKSVSIKNGNQTLLTGKSFKLSVSVSPSKASNKGLIYTSSDKRIATVSSSGVVSAVGVPSGKTSGTATITVKSADGGSVKASIKVTVRQATSSVSVKKKSVTLDKSNREKISFTVAPSNAYSKGVKFSSSNSNVATVDGSGVIYAKNVGTAKITVVSTDGLNRKSEVTVVVKEPVVKVTSISVPKTTQNLIVGETFTISPVVAPAEASKYGFSYSSSNANVVKVASDGKVTAVGSGKASITVTVKDGASTSVKVNFYVKKVNEVDYTYNNFVSHMGLNKVAPSNSIPAFMKAGQSGGFMGIETDVRETKDGYFVVYHDDDISSRTDKQGKISEMTLFEIQMATMDVGSNISLYQGLTIPTLEEYLFTCKVYNTKPVLHIKNVRNYQALLDILKKTGVYEEAMITGSKATMEKIRKIDKVVDLYWLCNMSKSGIDWAAANKIQINSDYSYVTQELVEYAHSKKLKVGAWTVNNATTISKLIFKGVDFITTDNNYIK